MTILMKIFSSPNDYRAVSNQTFRANAVRRPLRSKWLPLDLKKGEEIVQEILARLQARTKMVGWKIELLNWIRKGRPVCLAQCDIECVKHMHTATRCT